MRVVFMGTPEFAVPSLEALAGAAEVVLVVTRPDAVRGRGRELVPSPVKECACKLGIPVLEASRIREEELARVRDAAPDLIAVAAFGCILPAELLAIPALDCVNVHASTLPRWRGAAPIQRAILAGDERAGVSIMRVVEALDAGAYCRQASVEVGDKGALELTAELARLGAQELIAALPALESGSAEWVEQDESLVTYAHKVEKTELLLDPSASARENLLRVRASNDAAPARAKVAGKGIRVLAASLGAGACAPGAVAIEKDGVLLGCSDGALKLELVRSDGKREVDAAAWGRGLRGDSLAWERV